jgi:hypothetical protein
MNNNNTDDSYYLSSSKSRGDALEKSVEFIFGSAGFKTQRNVRLSKYEIDVLAEIGDRKIVIECKNYQESSLTIRNLVHQWNSKNQIIKANKVIIVLAGLNVKESDHQLANQFDMEVWDEKDLTNLLNLSLKPDVLRHELLDKVSFKPITISEIYRREISNIVLGSTLSGIQENKEKTFQLFNHWLRVFIRTELQLAGVSKEDRLKHLELFEGSKEKGALFNILKIKRKESEYWDVLRNRLRDEKILSDEKQKSYIKIIDDLMSEYKNQNDQYSSGRNEEKVKKLILGRLSGAMFNNESFCRFGFDKLRIVEVALLGEEYFCINIEGINDKQANVINWILTSEYSVNKKENNGVSKEFFSWTIRSLPEITEKVYRILEEFFGYKEYENLRDYSLSQYL